MSDQVGRDFIRHVVPWPIPAGLPLLGRFLQTDPVGYDAGLNWYAYVGNDPVGNDDPSGSYVCGSGNSLWDFVTGKFVECGVIAGFVKAAKDVLAISDPASDDYQKINRALQYLGDPGERNGVVVAPTSFRRRTQMASGGPGGQIQVDIGHISAYASRMLPGNSSFTYEHLRNILGAAFLLHEARHELHFLEFGYPTSWLSERRNELNGYATQTAVLRQSGVSTELWSPGMSASDLQSNLWRAAVRSTISFCGPPGKPTGNC